MLTQIFAFILAFSALQLYANQQELASSSSAERPRQKLCDLVSAQSGHVLDLVQAGLMPLHLGRKSLLQEMSKNPDQLSRDLARIPRIFFGNDVFPSEVLKNRNVEERFELLARALRRYIGEQRAELIDSRNPGYIGQFSRSEIFYGVVQNFSARSVAMAYENDKLKYAEYASETGQAIQEAIFTLEPAKTAVLSVTFRSTKNMKNMRDYLKPDLIYQTQATLYYFLESGEVYFLHSYIFDDQGIARIAQSLY